MKNIIKLESLGLFILGIYLFSLLNYDWWWFLILILGPDISILGYVFGNKTGACSYNLFHHQGIAILLYLLGIFFANLSLQLLGIIMFSHSAMDRFFGYGLKLRKGFKFTHLGEIGK
ncbi:DUF4260 domain-containing protein [Flavobacterium geliluteum]|uniref:DUF4260 domain-containing protein n=1 Tax=Flavobacterium geliluteum TaxID=2816120 RepID=A0A940XGV5_9FLAO|nr:DUF4260 domain-containing protein [Flavobacterium geliluteum]MBP4139529.1 DUF4260 domain-containing protein [Flavobacterium geliluteum]